MMLDRKPPVAPADVPFFGNPDGMSCGQCVYKMMLGNFFPAQNWPFDKMDEFCGATPGKYTWPFKPLLELQKLSLDVISYITFDTKRFIDDPEGYLLEKYGPEGQQDNLNNSDMPATLAQAKDYLEVL